MNRSKHIAIALVVALVWSGASQLSCAQDSSSLRTETLSASLEAFGAGVEVSIELRTGKKIRGTIESLDAARIVLTNSKTILFENIKKLKVTKITYADTESRVMRVSAAVKELGYDHSVKLRLVSGKTAEGRIQQAGEESFFVTDGNAAPRKIEYDDVREIRPGATAVRLLGAFPPLPQQAPPGSRKSGALKKIAVTYAVIMLLIAASGGKDLP